MLEIFWNNITHRYNIINILIVFFLSVAATYQIHYWTNGIVLFSPLLTFVIFSPLFVMFSIKIWPWMKVNTKYDRESGGWKWIIVSLLAVYLIIRLWIGISDIPGDYSIHKHYVIKLLNGSVEGYPLYKEAPGYYPPLSDTIIAIFTNLSGLHINHSFLFVVLLISFMIPLISYKLARHLGFSSVLSLFFSGLIGLYGGFGQMEPTAFQTYLPAIQMYLPNISRNLSLLLFLVFLFLCFKINSSQRLSYNISISIGILIGLMGLTHPTGFCIAILYIFIIYGTIFKMKCLQKEVMLHLTISVFTGFTLASFHYVPLVFKVLHYGKLEGYMRIRDVFPSRFFWTYGPLPFLGLCAFLKKRKDIKSWMLSSVLIIIVIVLARVFLGWVIDVDKMRLGNFFIYKYSPYMFIFLALLATSGFENLFKFMKKMRFVVIAIMILIILIGYSTAIKYLEEQSRPQESIDYFPGLSKKEVIGGFYKREVIGTVIRNIFPEKGIEKLRFQVPDPQNTIIVPPVPPGLAYAVACESGLNVSYVNDHRILFKDFFTKTISQEERFKMVDVFYKDFKKGILRKDVLSFFKTNIFLSSYYDLEKKHIQLKKITSIIYNDKEYFLYKLNN